METLDLDVLLLYNLSIIALGHQGTVRTVRPASS